MVSPFVPSRLDTHRKTPEEKDAGGIHSELRFLFKASIFRPYETDLPLVTVKRHEKTWTKRVIEINTEKVRTILQIPTAESNWCCIERVWKPKPAFYTSIKTFMNPTFPAGRGLIAWSAFLSGECACSNRCLIIERGMRWKWGYKPEPL